MPASPRARSIRPLVIVIAVLAVTALVSGWLLRRCATEDTADFDVTAFTENITELRVMAGGRFYIANVDNLIPELKAALHTAEYERFEVPAGEALTLSTARTLTIAYADGREAMLISSGPETWYHPVPESRDYIVFEGRDLRIVHDAMAERFEGEGWWP